MHLLRTLRRCGLLGVLCLLAACAGHPTQPAASAAPPSLTAPYAAAARTGSRVYRLNAGNSRVLILVGKAGPLSGLGHRHVILVGDLRGFAKLDAKGHGQADLRFPVNALVIDPAAAQKLYAHYSMPSSKEVAGTRAHMLGPVLASSRYPWVTLHITGRIDGTPSALDAAITLHGTRRTLKIDGDFTYKDSALTARGRFPIKQSAFGITPYSVMLGALRVKDTLQIRYHLIFHAWCPAPPSAGETTC